MLPYTRCWIAHIRCLQSCFRELASPVLLIYMRYARGSTCNPPHIPKLDKKRRKMETLWRGGMRVRHVRFVVQNRKRVKACSLNLVYLSLADSPEWLSGTRRREYVFGLGGRDASVESHLPMPACLCTYYDWMRSERTLLSFNIYVKNKVWDPSSGWDLKALDSLLSFR